MRAPQLRLSLGHELIVDNFAGGGGASLGIEQAFGRPVDIAINHDAEALAMHKANHPHTRHFCEDVFDVDPLKITRGRQVGLAWFSPDCTYHSKARGGKPFRDRQRAKRKRGLAWIVIKWARTVKPRVLMLENVEEFQNWGPLLPDGKPCPMRRGLTFRRWCRQLENAGYKWEARELRGCDYGAPTIRKRLFIIARCDGLPIRWPKPTHGKGKGLKPYRTAAECIDWTLPCPSIFLTKEEGKALGVKRPLAPKTERRIARGIKRFVLDAADPFIVPLTHGGDDRVHDIHEPLRTITTANRGEHALAAPYLIPRYGERPGQEPRTHAANAPLPTITPDANCGQLVAPFLTKYRDNSAGADIQAPAPTITANSYQKRPGGNPPIALAMAFLAKHFGGNETPGWPLDRPISTLTAKDHHHLVASNLVKLRGTCQHGQDEREPLHTVTGQGYHFAEVRAFLIKFYGDGGQWADPRDPMHTIPTRDRMGLVTVKGEDYILADIGMRMLTPRELYRAQGFREDYIIDPVVNGKRLTKEAQVRMVGNSVCPPIARALVEANFKHEEQFAEDVA